MKFKDLIHSVKFADVWQSIVKNYPDQESSEAGYINVFCDLLELEPVESEFSTICVELVKANPEMFIDEDYIDVSGRKDDDERWSIGFVDWAKWLDMEVESEFGEATTIAGCLWEMTFFGYSQEEIKGQWGCVSDAYQDAMSNEKAP